MLSCIILFYVIYVQPSYFDIFDSFLQKKGLFLPYIRKYSKSSYFMYKIILFYVHDFSRHPILCTKKSEICTFHVHFVGPNQKNTAFYEFLSKKHPILCTFHPILLLTSYFNPPVSLVAEVTEDMLPPRKKFLWCM
jgi:hypothetical protein